MEIRAAAMIILLAERGTVLPTKRVQLFPVTVTVSIMILIHMVMTKDTHLSPITRNRPLTLMAPLLSEDLHTMAMGRPIEARDARADKFYGREERISK